MNPTTAERPPAAPTITGGHPLGSLPPRSRRSLPGPRAPGGRGLPPTRVFIVDDHAVTRAGIRTTLERAGGFTVIGEAGDAARALRGILEHAPDVALIDLRLPGGDGVEVVRELRSRSCGTRCLILTAFSDEAGFFQAVLAGAVGYVLKDQPADQLIDSCRKAAAGVSLLEPDLLDQLRHRVHDAERGQGVLADLTPQERRILQFISEGLTNREIADHLHLAEKTVRNYVSNVLTKMDMRNRTMAAAYMAQYAARIAAR